MKTNLIMALIGSILIISAIIVNKRPPIQSPSEKVLKAQYRLLNHKKINLPDSVVIGFYMEDSTRIYAFYFDNAVDKLVPLGVYYKLEE